jgi:stalled ribosome alternative rescue factor ArfA
MRKKKAEDDAIKGMLRDEYNRCMQLMEQVKQSMGSYPRGRLVVKKVKAKGRVYEYHHLQWREGKKVLSRHVPEKEIPELLEMIEQREAYRSNCLKLEKRLEYLAPLIGEKKPSRRSCDLKNNALSASEKKASKNNKEAGGGSPRIKQAKRG